MPEAVVRRLTIYPLVIPLREKIMDASAVRGVGDSVVVAVELTSGLMGFGETVPRPYVTGETVPGVVDSLCSTLPHGAMLYHPQTFPEALEFIEALPWHDAADRPIVAARAALELALLDASMRFFRRTIDDVVQWMGLPRFGTPGSIQRVRFSGLLPDASPAATVAKLRSMYWHGLRHFKLKVGMAGDRERLRCVFGYLDRPIHAKRATLRVDADGAWVKDDAIDWLAEAADWSIASLEQPLSRGSESDLRVLHDLFELPLVHDQSLVTMAEAHRLVDLGVADVFNIAISKCGGMLPALRLAAFAQRSGVGIHLGCSVGETSVLAAAGLRFLSVVPGVLCAEGCRGTSLLTRDVGEPSLRSGFGGRPPRLCDQGLGVTVLTTDIDTLCEDEPIVLNL